MKSTVAGRLLAKLVGVVLAARIYRREVVQEFVTQWWWSPAAKLTYDGRRQETKMSCGLLMSL